MNIIRDAHKLKDALTLHNEAGKRIGFVPTMGALHRGHTALIDWAQEFCDVCVASIFVNPRQFNDSNDLVKYPRSEEKDVALLAEHGCHYVFIPTVDEIYPDDRVLRFDLGEFDKPMEGKFRPGHFHGMAEVVYRLFKIVAPHDAFFGEKDYQQLMIIKHLVKTEQLPVSIHAVTIQRENDGLAISSRNQHLKPEERAEAPMIYDTLRKLSKQIPEKSVSDIQSAFVDEMKLYRYLNTEYISVVDNDTMKKIKHWKESNHTRICVAVWCGKTRLIDNIELRV